MHIIIIDIVFLLIVVLVIGLHVTQRKEIEEPVPEVEIADRGSR